MAPSRSSTVNSMDATPAGQPDFEALFQEQDQNPDMFTGSNTSSGGQFHQQQHQMSTPERRRSSQSYGQGQQAGGGSAMNVMMNQSGQQRGSTDSFQFPTQQQPLTNQQRYNQQFQFPTNGNGQQTQQTQHHHQQQQQMYPVPTQDELLRAWAMQNPAQAAALVGLSTPPPGNNAFQQQNPFNTPSTSNNQQYQSQPFTQPNPFLQNLDPMTYRSPARTDRNSVSPQPSPSFHPTHLSQSSITHSLSPQMVGSGDDFGYDFSQQGLSPGRSHLGDRRRLSVNGLDGGAGTPSYAGSVGSGVGDLEDAFAGGWGDVSDYGAGGGGASYAPSTHGQDQQQDIDFGLDLINQDNQKQEMVDYELMARLSGNVPDVQGQEGGSFGMGGGGGGGVNGNVSFVGMGSVHQGLSGFTGQGQGQPDDGYMRERIAQYIASTTGQQAEVPLDSGVMFTEPGSYDDIALLTGNNPPESSGFENQQATTSAVVTRDNTYEGSEQKPNISAAALQGAFDSNEQSEFAKRMNSMASDMTMSTSGNNTPVKPFFPNGISENPGDGIGMPPFPTDEASLAERRARTSTKKRSLGPDGSGYRPTFMKPSPPIGRAGLPTKQLHLQQMVNKPASPPQLIIPDTTSSPAANADPVPDFKPYPHQQPQTTFRGASSLFPTANGLLGIPSGGNGVNGPYMSPIGPHGPSINIVPSTPTSALRDGQSKQGIWENLAAQARQAIGQNNLPNHQNHSQETPWNAMPLLASAGWPGAYGNEGPGPRRNSHAGTYTANAPPNLPTVIGGQVGGDMSGGNQSFVPATAPLAGNMLGRAHPQRQRSRSETDLASLPSNVDLRMVQQAILLQALGAGYGNGSSSGGRNNFGGSALDTGEVPNSLSQAGYSGNGNASGSQFGSGGQNHIVPGPEAFGINYIITNDGRRIPFNPEIAASQAATRINHATQRSMDSHGSGASQEDLDAALLRMAEPHNSFNAAQMRMQGRDNFARMPGNHRVVQSEDLGGSIIIKKKNMPVLTSSSLVPPQEITPSVPRSRDSSPYSRPEGGGLRRASNASSVGSAAMALNAAAALAKGAASKKKDTAKGKVSPVRQKVTTSATEAASKVRRTADGQYVCPVPGCGSTFTRAFNLKGHVRSHNEERPYKCPYDNCDKAFARQHDAKRHSQLHIGLKPFQCEGCSRTFARLDALSRHHKTDSGVECATAHPLPTNPDGTPLTESKFKAEMARRRSSASASGGERPMYSGLQPMTPADDDEDMEEEEEDVKPKIGKPRGKRGSVMM